MAGDELFQSTFSLTNPGKVAKFARENPLRDR
jgi:hypothetical protein